MSRDPEQHLRALKRANEIQLKRRQLKRDVASGTKTVAEVILAPPPEALTMTVDALLQSQRRWGVQRSRKVLAQVPISETKTVGALTDRQRNAIAALLS